MRYIFLFTAIMVAVANAALAAQVDKPADNMAILAEKIRADKKLFVAHNMQLTEAEAKNFWPVYDAYQADLARINTQLMAVIHGYAREFNANTLTDDKAAKLLGDSIAVEEAEAKLKRSYIPRLTQVLSAKKAARYLQIENKIRAIIRYEMADGIPLAP